MRAPHDYETGSYQLNGGVWTPFAQTDPGQQPSPTSNGEYTLMVNMSNISSIAFRAPDVIGSQHHEYSVAGLNVEVPEPGTLTLLGLGFAAIAARSRRRRYSPPRI